MDYSRDEKLLHARRLLRAIESGDVEAERQAADAIARRQSLCLHEELHRIAGALRDALCNVHVAGELARLAHRELPDAQLRLNQVIGLTEDAAHRTLTAVEESLPIADHMIAAVEAYRASRSRRGKALDAMLDGVLNDAGELRQRLSEVMMAQSFQDLTGQILKRVVGLVAELESLLGRSGDRAARERAADRAERLCSNAGEGPPLPGAVRAGDVVEGQQDVDDLLSELGV
ncbi:MAG: protein phosphatase CheZ [Gammaproteobacteria bacterium]|nr:protein phosphatase CheZ [Gammaproteobacteria bacterium]